MEHTPTHAHAQAHTLSLSHTHTHTRTHTLSLSHTHTYAGIASSHGAGSVLASLAAHCALCCVGCSRIGGAGGRVFSCSWGWYYSSAVAAQFFYEGVWTCVNKVDQGGGDEYVCIYIPGYVYRLTCICRHACIRVYMHTYMRIHTYMQTNKDAYR